MRTILVPLDGSPLAERALPHALRISVASRADILLTTGEGGDLDDAGRVYLEELAGTLGAYANGTGTVVHLSAERVVELAQTAPDPLIIMANRSPSGLGNALFATVDETVVRRARCPILLIGPTCAGVDELRVRTRLLVCTDGSAHSEAVVPAAAAVAKDLRLHPIVFQVSPANLLVASVGRPRDVESARRVAQRMHDEGLKADYQTTRDPDPAAAIIELAAQERAGVIAIATHGRTGLARVVLGSVAAEVVSFARCPVLVVRPDLN